MEKKELDKIEIVEVGYRGYFILVCIILLCACGIICLLMNRLKNTTFENRELKDKIAEQTKDCPNNSIPVYLTQTDLINLLFTNKLNKEETITEYSIDDIFIEDINQFMGSGIYATHYNGVDKNSIFAVVTYSVKPNGSYGKSIWNNNNGTYEDEWVKGKKSYIHVKKTSNGYVIDGDGYGVKW